MKYFVRTLLVAVLIGWLISWWPVFEALAGSTMQNPQPAAPTPQSTPKPESIRHMAPTNPTLKDSRANNPQIPIYDIPLSEELQAFVYRECQAAGVDYEMVLAMMGVESGYQAYAVSKTNDYGLMQINISNHNWLAEKLEIKAPDGCPLSEAFLDPEENIRAGIYLLSIICAEYEDLNKVLMAYNMGESRAAELWKDGKVTSTYSRTVLARRGRILGAASG